MAPTNEDGFEAGQALSFADINRADKARGKPSLTADQITAATSLGDQSDIAVGGPVQTEPSLFLGMTRQELGAYLDDAGAHYEGDWDLDRLRDAATTAAQRNQRGSRYRSITGGFTDEDMTRGGKPDVAKMNARLEEGEEPFTSAERDDWHADGLARAKVVDA